MSDSRLDALDLRIVNALQFDPRARWEHLAPALGASAVTLARRWDRLHSEGLAWVTGAPTTGSHALIEIESAPSESALVAEHLIRDPAVRTLERTAGDRDLVAFVSAADQAELTRYLVAGLGAVPGVRRTRVHVLTDGLTEATRWRLGVLTDAEIALLPAVPRPRPRAARTVSPAVRAVVEQELWKDGRAPVGAIAEQAGVSAQTVTDAIARLRDEGAIVMRTDLAAPYSRWPVHTWYFIEADAREIDALRTGIRSVREVRFAFTSTGRTNLVLAASLRSITDINRFESALSAAFSRSRIADRSLVLLPLKHTGRRLRTDGTVDR
ncbi:AsnC family transcriptional regulator [Agromyces rhizosphaerae]|uniref:AsnC family transcriptional regulator n=1 Tax=Agromyces rhizosphaerae TaxID=88374 RepID=A0A9W6CX47_9MICO|nr:Lrp/AsnC family transcriptional regulator [Agromyces rhizosphaerae]GLI27275.1 AsnC family transcriptional regulator [Agromyces rhizosphaerae]